TSQRVLTSTFLSLAKPRFSELPWPRMPMLATTTRSFAPRTRSLTRGAIPAFSDPKAPPAATAAAAAPTRDVKSRRVTSFRLSAMTDLLRINDVHPEPHHNLQGNRGNPYPGLRPPRARTASFGRARTRRESPLRPA